MLIRVYTCQNATLLEITCHGPCCYFIHDRFKRQITSHKSSGDWLVKYAIHTNAAVNSSTINSVIEDYQSKCSPSVCPTESIGPNRYAILFAKTQNYISKFRMFEDVNVVNGSLTRYKIRYIKKARSCLFVVCGICDELV